MTTWRVNSYGYPNPFGGARSREAWEMFLSFTQHASYAALKDRWEHGPEHPVSPNSVESRKATFEEFGLVYVLAGIDEVHVTPGGYQLLDAAAAGDEQSFAWTGLNLILRYPLSGVPGRRSRGDLFHESDLLLYRALHALFLDLDGYIWQSEFFRVIARAFSRQELATALEEVRRLRLTPGDMGAHPDPGGGATYNALNQVMVHGSLNHMLFTSERLQSPYFPGDKENRWYLVDEYRNVIDLALGAGHAAIPAGCLVHASHIDRLPAAPSILDEAEYFDYLGAEVTPLNEAATTTLGAPAVAYGGETVYLLTVGVHCDREGSGLVRGPVAVLCALAPGQRVILSDDLERTHIVDGKQLAGDAVEVAIHPARPIHDPEYVARLFEGTDD